MIAETPDAPYWAVIFTAIFSGEAEAEYGETKPCQAICANILQRLTTTDIDAIMEEGLHEFLSEHVDQNNRLGLEISRSYLLG